jgi:hypothetical protein
MPPDQSGKPAGIGFGDGTDWVVGYFIQLFSVSETAFPGLIAFGGGMQVVRPEADESTRDPGTCR